MPTFNAPITTDAADGACRRLDTVWANIVAAGGTFEDRSGLTTLALSKALVAGDYFHSIILLRFDLSSFPSNGCISGGTIDLYLDAKGDVDGVTYSGDFYDFGGSPAVAADWILETTGAATVAVEADPLTVGAIANLPIEDNIGLLQGIPNGLVAVRITPDVGAGAPTGDNFLRFAANEHLTGDSPSLSIFYEEFPTLPIQDDFDRSNSATVGSRWTESGTGGLQIIGNQLAEESSDGSAFLNDILAADVEWYGEKGDASLNDRWLQWRAKNVARTGDPDVAWSGYQLRIGNDIVIERWSGSALTTIATIAVEIHENEMVGIKHVGNNIKVFAKDVLEQGRILGDPNGYTDNTYLDAGRLRVEFSSSLGRWEYVGGGSLDEEVEAVTAVLYPPKFY